MMRRVIDLAETARILAWAVYAMRVHFSYFILLFLPCGVSAQTPSEEAQKTNSEVTAPAVQSVASAQNRLAHEEHPRLFWIIPTYSVSNSKSPVPLTPREKFYLFLKDSTDPYTLGYAAFTAGLQQSSDDPSGYGQGAAGYGKRLGANLADETSAGFFVAYVFPSVLHQDPRYFRQGSGPFKDRLAHAMIRPIVTHKDSGGRAFNYSGMLGGIVASSLSNAYYPETDRGAGQTFERVATGIPFSVIDHLVDEFGPDLERKFLRRR